VLESIASLRFHSEIYAERDKTYLNCREARRGVPSRRSQFWLRANWTSPSTSTSLTILQHTDSREMAMSQEQVKALDRLRQQLSQFTASVSTLRYELETQDPLPTW
jgi:hypothetical protein